jgi:hypothetical protein
VYVDYMVKDRLHAFARPIGPLGILPKKTTRAPSSTLIKKKRKVRESTQTISNMGF